MALGFGFRCGFLGLLHLEIVQERLRREYGMDIIATYPSVVYRVTMTDKTVKEIDNPAFLPEPNYIEKIEEPTVKSFIICPNEYIGDMMALISEKRGIVDHTETLDSRRVMLTSVIPLNEILIDFHDRIKSREGSAERPAIHVPVAFTRRYSSPAVDSSAQRSGPGAGVGAA